MTELILQPNLPDPDAAYAMLVAAHEGRDERESHALNARLVLILANHLGDPDLLAQAIAAATE
ncbi:DUF2783 domain-containing protein [Jannaschia ovalis]|uniref:DUF2783 domain-containing protein n=1 Tax=Jannaschia ovalis TaxID=3038773 RepID=A0ABY8LBH2_9RHOB|nr:DUF2783 domain-containing protein [Jannaschia sp. GRR-S6-38]WGH78686.1 DUF2783 domain-containing protein [Jannaschia sp. GRR-S6-38]